MNKLIMGSSALVCFLSLAGCNTMGDGSQLSNQTVGQGFKYTANVIGSGAHMVAATGASVGNGVANVAGTGVGLVTKPLSSH